MSEERKRLPVPLEIVWVDPTPENGLAKDLDELLDLVADFAVRCWLLQSDPPAE